MSDYYKYHVFGLNILSSIELPDLNKKVFQQEDVTISFEKNPSSLDKITTQGLLYQARKDHFLFRLDQIASYYVKNGERITIDVDEQADLKDVGLFLMGPVFGALILQRGLLPLHGSSVVNDKYSTVFCGKSGTGKSTIAALLSKKGYSILADDISVVKFTGSHFSVSPGITNLKLWEDIAKQLYQDYIFLPKVRDQLLRYKIPTSSNPKNKNNQISSIVVIEQKNSRGFEIEEVFGAKKFALLKDNTYREQFIEGLETTLNHFHQINNLIQNVKVYILRRPDSSKQLYEFADFVEENLIQKKN